MNIANESTINPHYWRRYGFSRDPFNTPEQKEFFIPDSWEEYLDLLPQFARFCDTLLLIIGHPGVGKSTLINLFTNEQSTDTDIFALRATDCPSAHHFLQLLNQRYGAPYDPSNSVPASEQLHQQLEFLREEKASRLLIIDAAEKLPLDMRQLCLQIIQQQNALTTCLPIILVGEDSLSSQMHALLTPTTAQKCLYTIHVEPFSEDETEQYLRWCCAQAAGDKMVEFPFTPEDIATIFQQSHGVIGTINPIAQRLLSNRSKPSLSLPIYLRGKVLWWSGAIIIITLLLIVYQQLTKPHDLDTLPAAPVTNPAAPPAVTPPPTSQNSAATNSTTANPSASTAAAPATTAGASAADLPVSAATPTNTAAPTQTPTEPTAATPAQPAAAMPAPTTPATSVVQKNKSATKLFATSMSAELQEHQTRVMHTPPQNYTLQLMASPNLHAVQKFIVYHQLSGVAMIVPTEREGKFNYVVLYGNFPTHSIATQTKAHLQQTKHINGWLRTYKSVQELIKSGENTSVANTKPIHKKSVHKKVEPTNNSESW